MAFQTFFKSQLTPRVTSKQTSRQKDEQAKRDAYKVVDERDGKKCRACGRRCRQTLECVPDRLEHHHYLARSLGGEHRPENLVTLCLEHHAEATLHTLIITGHPDQVLTFERAGKTWEG